MDDFNMDGHKLIYHILPLSKWIKGENIYPIYADIGLSGGCNQRCIFCTFDYQNYKTVYLQEKQIREFIKNASKKGLKSILYSGEGEPLLHSQAGKIIEFTKKKGIDVALSTNGVFLDKKTAEKILPYLSWIRVSINAGTLKKYNFIHGAKPSNFDKVLTNLKLAVKIRNKNNYACTIGAQSLLLPQNYKNIPKLAATMKGIGVDYLTVKPFSRHPSSCKKFDYGNIGQQDLFRMKKKLLNHSRDNFRIIYRQRSLDKLKENKNYKRCLGFSFSTRITAQGDVYPCIALEGKKKYLLGNICKESFSSIWEGKRRKEIIERIYSEWNINECRKPCRLDEINCYLWELKHPGRHINFI